MTDNTEQTHPPKKSKHYEKEFSFSLSSLVDQIGAGLSDLGKALSGDAGGEAPDAGDFHYELDLEDAESATVQIDIERAQLTLRNLEPESAHLLTAHLRALGPLECLLSGVEDGSHHRQVRIGKPKDQKTQWDWRGWRKNAALPWDVALSARIPLHLKVNSGLGTNTLLLQELNLRELRLNGGAGKSTVLLPATPEPYRVRLSAGAGKQHVSLAPGAHCELKAERGVGKFSLQVGEDCQLQGHISGGAGACEIELPPGAAVLLRVNSGIGGLHLPDHFHKLRGQESKIGNDGVWYSGYDAHDEGESAAIQLKLESGVGGIHIHQAEHV